MAEKDSFPRIREVMNVVAGLLRYLFCYCGIKGGYVTSFGSQAMHPYGLGEKKYPRVCGE